MSRIKEIILALAIVVVLNLFFNYGVYTFYKPPKYDAFCSAELNQRAYNDKQSCEAVGGKWFESNTGPEYYRGGAPVPVQPEVSKDQKGWCDATAKCRENYQNIQNIYNRNVFVILVVLGLVSLVLGFLVIEVGAVANGFLGGGLLSLIIGTIRYWSDMNDYLRFIILGLALALLIFLGYKKFSSK